MGQVPRSSQPTDTSASDDAMNLLLNITDVSMEMVQFVVVMATYPDPQYPHAVFSMEGCKGKAEITNDVDGMYLTKRAWTGVHFKLKYVKLVGFSKNPED